MQAYRTSADNGPYRQEYLPKASLERAAVRCPGALVKRRPVVVDDGSEFAASRREWEGGGEGTSQRNPVGQRQPSLEGLDLARQRSAVVKHGALRRRRQKPDVCPER